jgi:amidase
MFKEYRDFDALGLAELIRNKSVKAEEVLEAAIAAIEAVNPRLNAVVTTLYDEGRRMLSEADPSAPLYGVPFLLKDLLIQMKGTRYTRGSRAFAGYVSDHDTDNMLRYRSAGLCVLGKTNTPEFGLMGITEPELHGPTRNPWDVSRSPGGSSGGSAAAVASGMVPAASAGDGGGSIRIPASCTGLFGLKPSRGRTPNGPDVGEPWQGAAVSHALTRSVRDSAALLDILAFPGDPGAPYQIQEPSRRYLEEISNDPGRLRIAFTRKTPFGTDLHAESRNAVEECAKLLEDLGHEVVEDAPDYDWHELTASYLTMYFGEVAAEIANSGIPSSRHRDSFEFPTRTSAVLGSAYSAGDFASAINRWNSYGRMMADFHQRYDLFLTPTMAQLPPLIGQFDTPPLLKAVGSVLNTLRAGGILRAMKVADRIAEGQLSTVPFTQLANLTGQPAMSVPLYWTGTGIPMGSHFIAPMGREDLLFRLASQLEAASPWFDKHTSLKLERGD